MNNHPASEVKAEVVRMAMKKWPMKFSRNFEACLVSGPKVPKGDVILSINSVGVNVFADNDMRPFSFGLEYSSITRVGSARSVPARLGRFSNRVFISIALQAAKWNLGKSDVSNFCLALHVDTQWHLVRIFVIEEKLGLTSCRVLNRKDPGSPGPIGIAPSPLLQICGMVRPLAILSYCHSVPSACSQGTSVKSSQ